MEGIIASGPLEVTEDAVDDRRVGEDRDDPHLALTLRTEEGIDLEDPPCEPTQPPQVLPARAPPQGELEFGPAAAPDDWPEMDQTAGNDDEGWA